MSHFILPVTIESRKILFLDLSPGKKPRNRIKEVGEDEYIVELPVHQPRTILSISKLKSIQSLHNKVDDLPLKDLGIQLEYNDAEKILLITISNEQTGTAASDIYELEPGLDLKAEIDDDDIRLELVSAPNFTITQSDHFFVNFLLNIKEDKLIEYAAGIKLCLGSKGNILFTGFDFGSEASQICEGRYSAYENATIDPQPIDLFSAIRTRLGKNPEKKDEDYDQYEIESQRLYKSIFYLKKQITATNFDSKLSIPGEAINALTLSGNKGPAFFNEWMQIPNLKLIHDNPALTNAYKFTITSNGQAHATDLSELRVNIYAGLLKEMLLSHFIKRIRTDVYLRFTLLVPNIYSAGQINETKQIIRKIILEANNGFSHHIKGLEISSLSESDAAFLGYLSFVKANPGDYYIIIDCGKGTTDFSIIQSEKNNPAAFKSVYRNGFAGAGNLITFALMQSVLHYLKEYTADNPQATVHFDAFIKDGLTKGPQNNIKNVLFDLTELWKKKYDPQLSQTEIETNWDEARSSSLTLENLFSKSREHSEFQAFLSVPEHVYDWGGYVESAINEIVSKMRVTLAPVITHMNKTAKCGGILFTGRGFLFKPLEEAAKNALQSIKGMGGVQFLDNSTIDLKEICLNGVFARNILSYSDIVSTPIEIAKGKLKQFTKADIKKSGFFGGLKQFFDKLIGRFDGAYFDEATNSCPVLNPDFTDCQFLIGGKIYQPEWTSPVHLETAHIIHSRQGFFIRAKNARGQVFILDVYKTDVQIKGFKEQDTVTKSLFPGWFDPELLKINHHQ